MKNKRGLSVMPPSTEFGNGRAYSDYVKNGDGFFRSGLTFDEFINQRDTMLNTMQKTAQSQPYFYSKCNERYGDYR